MFDRYGCNKYCLSLFGVLCLTVTAVIGSVLSKFIWSVVFGHYGCNRFCLSLFGVLCLAITAVISSV